MLKGIINQFIKGFRMRGIFSMIPLLLILLGCRTYSVDHNEIEYDQHVFTVHSSGLISVREKGIAKGNYNYEDKYQDFKVASSGSHLNISTDKCQLAYYKGEGAVYDRIQISFKGVAGELTSKVNQPDKLNLGGVIKSVDRCDGRLEYSEYDYNSPAAPLEIPKGLLSQRGFTVLKSVDGTLVHGDKGSEADELFIFCYGADYKGALKDFTNLNGKVPLLPKWTLGTWFSRYQPLTADDYKSIVKRFRKEQIPIDVIVPDMNWHKDGWFGTRFDKEKFPDMKGFFEWTHENGIHVGFNHHPGAVIRDDERSKLFCEMADLDYDSLLQATIKQYEESGWEFIKNALFYGEGNPDHIKPFFETFLSPIMDLGLDFHWVDGTPSVQNLENYYKLTEAHNNQRAIVLTRQVAGSFDHHRFPIGFSADSYISWESLRYNTELTVMGANNGIYWSHDIGGHMECLGDIDYKEMFARWVQAGAMSPFCRLHATGGEEWDRRQVHCRQPWQWGEQVLDVTRKILQLKYALMPYTYSLSRVAHDEGLLICYGMYMDYPEYANAYKYANSQYMYGPSVLVAPIMEAAPDNKGVNGNGVSNVWIPEGTWYDYYSGESIQGPVETLVSKTIDEMPLFIKEGAIIPMMEYMEYSDQYPLDHLNIEFYQPTESMKTSFTLYEDDGKSLLYKSGAYQQTIIDYEYDTESTTKITIHPCEGEYLHGIKKRSYSLILKHLHVQPQKVSLNGQMLGKEDWQITNTTLTIDTEVFGAKNKITVIIE
ncbi:DUF5110 domain-containing protein [Labilibacter sediminis]|nr:DUF5110 domain-containing protein [Labilibacter sediminis]